MRADSPASTAFVLAACLVSASGCAREGAPAGEREDQLVVFAASSLREAFTAIAADFEAKHAGVKVTLQFAGTQELRTQLEHGAGADVFASADQKHMDELVKAKLVRESMVFAKNEPVVVVAKEAGEVVRSLADLPSAQRIVVGTPEVPIGRYTLQIFDRAANMFGADFRARVEAKIVSRELNVRQVLNKVKLGEADAGVVYRTDAVATPELQVVSIPPELNVIAEYPIGVVVAAKHPKLARAWVEYVRSEGGQAALARAGFRGR